MLDDDFLVERLLVDIKQVVRDTINEAVVDIVRDTIREEIALLGISREADAEHGLPVTPRSAETEPRVLFTGLGTHIKPSKAAKPSKVLIESNPLVVDLRDLRSQTAKHLGRLPYHIFSDSTLNGIVAKMPRDKDELLDVWGIGPEKVDLYGSDIIRIVNRHQPSSSQKTMSRVEYQSRRGPLTAAQHHSRRRAGMHTFRQRLTMPYALGLRCSGSAPTFRNH